MGKGGVPGTGMLAIPIVALMFGGKPSTGLILPLLIFADITAVIYYKKHLNTTHFFRILPWAFLGVLIALFVGDMLNDSQFLLLMSIVIISGLILVIAKDFNVLHIEISNNYYLAIFLGLTGGFASMIGNAAGPIITLYLLSIGFKKNEFIGTRAWIFFVINLMKLPLHIFFWKTITVETFSYSLWMLPVLLLGVYIGIKLMKILPERLFKIVIYTTAIASSIILLV